MKLYIKNMVCNRCIMVVRSILKQNGIEPESVTLGEVMTDSSLTASRLSHLRDSLDSAGFEMIDDKRSRLIEKTKTAIIELVHRNNTGLRVNLSDYLHEILQTDYSGLSSLFSEVEGITIEKYYIAQKIERVKELLFYDELSLKEIAFQLHYSSVAHLSAQFKSVIGLTPTQYKKLNEKPRKPLDQV